MRKCILEISVLKLARFEERDMSQLISMIPDSRFLLQWAGPKYKFPLDADQLKETLVKTKGDLPTFQVYKAVQGKSKGTVGHIQLMEIDYQSSTCILGRVLIYPDFRGKGLGSEMVRLAVAEAFEKIGLRDVTLGVFNFNTSAIATYKRVGFIEYYYKKAARQFENEFWDIIKMRKESLMNKDISEKSLTKDWFKDWANEYDETLGKVKRHHQLLDLVIKLSKVQKDDAVLDIGCGTGLLSLKFLENTPCSIVAIDSSSEMLSIFRDKIKKLGIGENVTSELEDAETFNFKDESFDIVASTVALHHVEDKYPVIEKIHSILKPGGRFVLGDINVDTTGELTDSKRLFRIIDFLKQELAIAIQEGGIDAFNRMYDNGRKHILNDGEYCLSFEQWKELCLRGNFSQVTIKPLPNYEWFNVLVAIK